MRSAKRKLSLLKTYHVKYQCISLLHNIIPYKFCTICVNSHINISSRIEHMAMGLRYVGLNISSFTTKYSTNFKFFFSGHSS